LNLGEYQKHEHFHILKFKDHLQQISKERHSKLEDYFELTISENHSVDIDIDGTKFSTEKGQIIFLSHGQKININIKEFPDDEDLGIMILFTAEFLPFAPSAYNIIQRFPFYNMNQTPFYTISSKYYPEFLKYIEEIYSEFQNLNEDSIEIIRANLTTLLFKAKRLLMRNNLESTLNTRPEIITYKFENLLKNTTHKKQKISYYSDLLNISSVYLSECVKKVTGKPAKHVITEYIIFEAKSLIIDSNNTLENIAFQLGFDDSSNFINFFKKNTSLTPSQYRKQFLNEK
jgi:AraC-like DNA-binding protein